MTETPRPKITCSNWARPVRSRPGSMEGLLDAIKEAGLKRLEEFIRVLRFLVVAAAIVCVTALYVINPFGKPILTMPGDNFNLEVPPFRTCSIVFTEAHHVDSYSILPIQQNATNTSSSIDLHTVGRELIQLEITNAFKWQVASTKDVHFRIHVATSYSMQLQVAQVQVDSRPVPMKEFLEHNLKTKAELTRTRYIRTSLADLLYSFNDTLSNWILSAMFFGTTLLVIPVLLLELRAHAFADLCYTQVLRGFHKLGNTVERLGLGAGCGSFFKGRSNFLRICPNSAVIS